MLDGLSFGWRTAILLLPFLLCLILSLALSRTLVNRSANRALAVLLLVLAGIFTPWMVGFAGFYDKWRWLTFFPVSITLAVAPLLWIHVHALIHGEAPDRSWRHLLPAAAQFGFLFGSFLLPMPVKDRWAESVGLPYELLTTGGTLAGLALYGRASLAELRRYRAALATQRSDDHLYAGQWLSRLLVAVLVLLPFWAVYAVWDMVDPLGYTGLMGLYAGIAAFAAYLAIEGWRHAQLPFPRLAALLSEEGEPPAGRDWAAQARTWSAQVESEGWATQPDLTLAGLARKLGTNSHHLSRAINEGLGVNFSTFIAAIRSRRVAELIDGGREDDLLDLALEAGFSSKASFNRAFQAAMGMAPSAYRRRLKS